MYEVMAESDSVLDTDVNEHPLQTTVLIPITQVLWKLNHLREGHNHAESESLFS